MRLIQAVATSALLLAGTPAIAAKLSGEQQLAKVLKDRVPGAPVKCIFLQRVRNTQIIPRTAIVYDAGTTIYVNRPEHGANRLFSNDTLVIKPHSSQLCNIDTVQILDQTTHSPRGFINLGDFVPYTKLQASSR